jgi:hypothetical protein
MLGGLLAYWFLRPASLEPPASTEAQPGKAAAPSAHPSASASSANTADASDRSKPVR